MGFRGHWGLGVRTLLHVQKAETAVHHQSFFRDSRVDRGGALGQETPVQKDGRWPFPHVHSQQPLLCGLSTVSWPLWCFLREHHPEEATANWSKGFATNSLRRGSRDSCLL